ncbi:hypothetical protein CRG98_028927 [Punica granatum]|uniref:Uncharacterized protein n=1 Tax=Punica granatum TaxID=22663 RepID=A0A2I0J422_PUNGR|nr:hypothetical protein CRG98_028927 [Punica granatum]
MEDISQKKEEQHFSVLRGEGSYFRKIISRDPSVGSTSSNGFLYFSPGNVPFNWEMQPGMSKTPPKNAESVPSIDPPPFLSNMELLPGPKIPEASKGSGPLGWSRVKFWVKIKKQRNLRKVEGRRSVDGLERRVRNGFKQFEFELFRVFFELHLISRLASSSIFCLKIPHLGKGTGQMALLVVYICDEPAQEAGPVVSGQPRPSPVQAIPGKWESVPTLKYGRIIGLSHVTSETITNCKFASGNKD